MGSSYSSLFMEVIICTPSQSGHLVNELCQNQAPGKGPMDLKRGQDKGDVPQTQNLKTNNTFSNKGNLITLKSPFWVGGFVALALIANIFVGVPQAHAADEWGNKDLAEAIKKVGQATTGVVSGKDQTEQSVDNFIEKPLVVETEVTPVIVPQAPKPVVAPAPAKVVASKTKEKVLASNSKQTALSQATAPHYFPYGYCTYYVAQKRFVPWSGNAGTWLSGARAAGYETGKVAQPGAIMVTSEGGSVGHVAYVESVSGDKVTISEMNFKGFGVVSTRTISAGSGFIKGYIY